MSPKHFSDLSECEDPELLRRVGQGDRDAFCAFYERHAGRVLSMLRHLCRDPEVAEDVLQEAFLAVWRKAASYRRERGDVAGWLFAISRNKAFDLRRRRAPVVAIDEQAAAEWATPEPPRELEIGLGQALATLKREERQALRLAYFGGFTYEETAVRLAVPLGTLKSRIRTGLRHLRDCLER